MREEVLRAEGIGVPEELDSRWLTGGCRTDLAEGANTDIAAEPSCGEEAVGADRHQSGPDAGPDSSCPYSSMWVYWERRDYGPIRAGEG